MPGITNITTVTLENITELVNFTGDPIKFMIKANYQIYDGWFYFIMLCILGIILYRIAQANNDQPMNNLMFVLTVLTMISFIFRLIYIVDGGIMKGFLTDFQMWMFPIIAIIFAGIIWFTKE